MKQEKFNIIIEKEILRCNSEGKMQKVTYPKSFGNKEKNKFIKANQENNILILNTPICKSLIEAYDKLEEITNVVCVELYNSKELIWPFSSFEDIDLSSKISLCIDKQFYLDMRKLNNNLPENLEDAYKNVKQGFNEKVHLLEKVFGKCTLKIVKNNIEISNIINDYSTRIGISFDEVCFLITFLFSLLEKYEANTVSEEIKILNKTSKLYSLKTTDEIKNVETKLKLKKSKKDLENELSFDEKLHIANEYMKEGYDTRYCLQRYKKIVPEAAAIIKDAISQGINYKISNESKSVVEFELNGHREFVIEGNKTDRDSYIFPIITDDKLIAKQIMAENGINVPNAILLESYMKKEDIEELLEPICNKPLVVKPRNTNYGIGITVFSKKANRKEILNAIDYAFKFDTNVLIEEYAKGLEYRFLVIDGKCLSVAHRRAASVVGDGKSTIKKLIDEKNKEPWHILTLCPVKSDEPVIEYLNKQGYTLDSIIPKGKRVFLRKNSNCSTGGESIDMTQVMPNKFKKIAEKTAKAFNAKICGVDIIIEDFEKDDYAIVEINDNPGYSINEWPYDGKGERIGMSILKLLGLVQE